MKIESPVEEREPVLPPTSLVVVCLEELMKVWLIFNPGGSGSVS